jgi:hypothetical protein
MGEETIQTDVDKLIDILKINKRMEVSQIAKELNLPEETVQTWANFLVEENIIAIDYNFTKPALSLIKSKTEKDSKNDFLQYKKKFQSNNLKKGNGDFAWKQHILNNVELLKTFFFSQAEQRDLNNPEELWEEYKEKVTQS